MLSPLLRTPDVTLALWTCQGHGSGWSRLERVDRPEIVVPVAGLFVRELHHREVVASPNVALFADRGDAYRVRHPEGAPLDRCAVFLMRDEDAVEELVATASLSRGSHPRGRLPEGAAPVAAETFLAIRRLVRAAVHGDDDALRSEEACSLLLLDLIGAGDRGTGDTGTGRRRAVLRALEYVSVHYRRPLSLDEVANVAGYSRFHFARIFREEVGIPVYRYVYRLRLREAFHAVEEGADDLSRLGLSLGFSSHSHFTAAFRRTFGSTPSEVRAAAQRGPPGR